MKLAMIFFAVLCIGIGIFPGLLYDLLPYSVNYIPYNASKVIGTLQLLMFSGLAFFICLPLMKRTLTISLDIDWFYRQALPWIIINLHKVLGPAEQKIRKFFISKIKNTTIYLSRYMRPNGILERTIQAGSMVFWAVTLLVIYLIMYLI